MSKKSLNLDLQPCFHSCSSENKHWSTIILMTCPMKSWQVWKQCKSLSLSFSGKRFQGQCCYRKILLQIEADQNLPLWPSRALPHWLSSESLIQGWHWCPLGLMGPRILLLLTGGSDSVWTVCLLAPSLGCTPHGYLFGCPWGEAFGPRFPCPGVCCATWWSGSLPAPNWEFV